VASGRSVELAATHYYPTNSTGKPSLMHTHRATGTHGILLCSLHRRSLPFPSQTCPRLFSLNPLAMRHRAHSSQVLPETPRSPHIQLQQVHRTRAAARAPVPTHSQTGAPSQTALLRRPLAHSLSHLAVRFSSVIHRLLPNAVGLRLPIFPSHCRQSSRQSARDLPRRSHPTPRDVHG